MAMRAGRQREAQLALQRGLRPRRRSAGTGPACRAARRGRWRAGLRCHSLSKYRRSCGLWHRWRSSGTLTLRPNVVESPQADLVQPVADLKAPFGVGQRQVVRAERAGDAIEHGGRGCCRQGASSSSSTLHVVDAATAPTRAQRRQPGDASADDDQRRRGVRGLHRAPRRRPRAAGGRARRGRRPSARRSAATIVARRGKQPARLRRIEQRRAKRSSAGRRWSKLPMRPAAARRNARRPMARPGCNAGSGPILLRRCCTSTWLD